LGWQTSGAPAIAGVPDATGAQSAQYVLGGDGVAAAEQLQQGAELLGVHLPLGAVAARADDGQVVEPVAAGAAGRRRHVVELEGEGQRRAAVGTGRRGPGQG
jgi:hypothetical protein